jgi:hypothetical protein
LIKAFVRKRENGNAVGDIVGSAICLMAILGVMIVSLHFLKILEAKRQVNILARDYLLVLEEQGELTSANQSQLQSRLNAMGFSHVTITYNGSNTKKNHGEEVSIEISISATPAELGISPIWGLISSTYTLHSKMYSTSKT